MMMQPARTQPSLAMDSPPSPRRSWMTMPMPTMIAQHAEDQANPGGPVQYGEQALCLGRYDRGRVRDDAGGKSCDEVHGETFRGMAL
jgi:hypothetical protein